MAVTYVKSSNFEAGWQPDSTADFIVSASSLAVGDVGILVLESDNGDRPSTPSGWTFLITGISSTGGQADKTRTTIFYRVATSTSLSATISVTADHVLGMFYVYRGVDTGSAAFGYKSEFDITGSNTGTHTLPAVTTTIDGTGVFYGWGLGDSTFVSSFSSPDLSGFVEVIGGGATGGSEGKQGGAFGIDVTAGSVAAGSFTSSANEEHVVLAIHLPPFVVGNHTLTADDLESASEISEPEATEPTVRAIVTWARLQSNLGADTEDPLLADNLESASELSTPAITQDQQLLADDLQGASQLSTPTLQQENALLADDLQSASQLSTPAIEETNVLTADDLRSASQLSTPALAQDQQLLADDLQGASELSTPAIAQENALLADDLQSASQLSTPAIAQENTLLADDLQSASELSTPDIGQVHKPTANDLRSASQLSTPTLQQENTLLANDLQSLSQVTTPDVLAWDEEFLAVTLTVEDALLADDLQSASQLSEPTVVDVPSAGEDVLTADNLQGASQLSTPALAQDQQLLADDIESASKVSGIGPDLVNNGGFDSDTSWLLNTGWTIAGGIANCDGSQTHDTAISQNTLWSNLNQLHILTFEYSSSAGEINKIQYADDIDLSEPDQGANTRFVTPTLGRALIIYGSTDFVGTLDNIVIRQLDLLEINQTHNLLADNLESASELTQPAVVDVGGTVDNCLADDLQSAAQLSTPTVAETLLRLVPDADTTVGNWTTHTGSATNLYQQIDEDSADDLDYIQSEPAPNFSLAKFKLSNAAVTAADTQRVKYRYAKDCDDGQQMILTVSLIEGASTVRAAWTHNNVGTTLTTADQLLTAPQKAAITDYDDLYIQFLARI